MRLPGQGIGFLILVITGLFVFLILSLSLLGVIAAPAGALAWRLVTKYESSVRTFLAWLFPHERLADEMAGHYHLAMTGAVTARAPGRAATYKGELL